ncbi:MAG TPA: DUF6788 family protein [Actinomycetota bacterium]|uniref:DUF6788 domain-containing protein n=1 Tax=Candidatus Segetimicrobium genomatis TaxID=2569760 RepID=A0A537IKA0_9BACT|nr:MAG: hypothetical protein E6H05_12170 [Terrabacteria group bacterium ANGP1]HKN49102.1 DUF6788 family protein [Actinomycetota bacterium]HYX26258.1 DUF6788 family protein [Thermoanaerobaculia bacterium]
MDPEQERRRLAGRLAAIDFALPGSLGRRDNVCGKPGCRCKADPPHLHGPYYLWTRKVDGKTVTRMLSEDQVVRYQPWFDNAAALRDIVRKLQALSVSALEQAEGWRDSASPR